MEVYCPNEGYPRSPIEIIGKQILAYINDKLGGCFAFRLVQLWQSWSKVIGSELAKQAQPLGHRRDIIEIGAVNAMAMQELHYAQEELLKRVNTFLGQIYFNKVELHLVENSNFLDSKSVCILPKSQLLVYHAVRPEQLGNLLSQLPAEHPVGRCY